MSFQTDIQIGMIVNNRKRSASEALDIDADPPMLKKRKIQCDPPQSKAFPNEQDQEQFMQIFQSLKTTDLISDLSIPSCIIQEIAEQTVGVLRDCDNPNCDHKVVILQQDNTEEDTKFFWPDHESYMYVWPSQWSSAAVFYCSDCKAGTHHCDYCRKIVFAPLEERGQCAICDWKLYPHGCDAHLAEDASRTWKEQCITCGNTICWDCVNHLNANVSDEYECIMCGHVSEEEESLEY